MDWAEACRVLGVPESATEAEIKEQYLYKAQLLHPDKNRDKPESVRNKAEAEFVLINQAYDFLTNPNNNPYKIPPRLVVVPLGIRFKAVNIGERKTTTLTVSNSGGPFTSVWIDNQPAPWLSVTGVKSITSEQLPLEVSLECVGIGEPGQKYETELLIKLENAKTQAGDRASVKIEMFINLKTRTAGHQPEAVNSGGKPDGGIDHFDPAGPQPRKNKTGFNPGAFVVNFLGLAGMAAIAIIVIDTLAPIKQEYLIIGLIVYTAIAFWVCFDIAKKNRREPPKNKTAKIKR